MSEYKWKYSLFACARWESDYIVEWISYHRAIGIDHIYLYCNDDDPTELYVKTECFNTSKDSYVTFIHYPWQGQQYYMYVDALEKFKDDTEWLMFLDIDEFLVLEKYNNVALFMESLSSKVDCIYFNWLVFGNNNFKTRPSGSVILQYTRCEENLNPNTKHFTRTSKINMSRFFIKQNTAFWHHWKDLVYFDTNVVNVVGDKMDNYHKDFPHQANLYLSNTEVQTRIMNVGVIHHYALKAESDTTFRLSRGTAGQFQGQSIWQTLKNGASWKQHLKDTNAIENLKLPTYWRSYMKRHMIAMD